MQSRIDESPGVLDGTAAWERLSARIGGIRTNLTSKDVDLGPAGSIEEEATLAFDVGHRSRHAHKER